MELNYENHLKRAISLYGDIDSDSCWNAGEHCVVLLRSKGMSYKQIQLWMGNPSKKWIREVLLKCAPDLIDKDCNQHKLEAKHSSLVKNIMNSVKEQSKIVEIDDEDWRIFWNDKELYLEDPWESSMVIDKYDELTQKKVLLQLNNG